MAIVTMPKGKKRKTITEDEASYIASSSSSDRSMITLEVASKELYNNVNTTNRVDNDDDGANHRFANVESAAEALWNTSFRSIDIPPLQVQSEPDLDLSASVFDPAVMGGPWRVDTMAHQNVATSREGGFCYEDNEGSIKKKGKYCSTSAAAATASNSQDQCDISPTPLNEAANLNIVDEISRLPKSILVEGNDMRALLQPLLKKDPPSYSTMTKVTKEASSTSSVAMSTKRITGPASSSAAASCPVNKGSSSCSSSDGTVSTDDSDESSTSSASLSYSSERGAAGAAAIASASGRHKHDQWNDRFQELIEYKRRHKDCDVPYRDSVNQPLAQWVKRQRYQHSLKVKGKHSNLTDGRQSLLESIGFVWDSRQSNWDDRFEELKSYKEQHGHVRLSPTTQDPRFRALAVWLKRQRIYARNFRSGDSSSGGMTEERFNFLVSLGVEIDAKRPSKKKKKKGT